MGDAVMKRCATCNEPYDDDSIEVCDICGGTEFKFASPKRNKPAPVTGNAGTQMARPKPVRNGAGQHRPAKIQTPQNDDIDFSDGFSNSIEGFDDGFKQNISQNTEPDMDFGDFDSDFENDDFGSGFDEPAAPVLQKKIKPQQQGQRPRAQRSPVAQQVANGQVQPNNQRRPAQRRQPVQGQNPANGQQVQQNVGGQTPEQMQQAQQPVPQPVQKQKAQPSPDGSSVLNWLVTFILLIIPLVNVGYMIKVIVDKTAPAYKKNYMKAFLIYAVVMCIISTVVAITLGDKIVGLL